MISNMIALMLAALAQATTQAGAGTTPQLLVWIMLFLVFAVVAAATCLRVKQVISGDAAIRLIAVAFIVGAAVFMVAVEGSGFTAVIGLLGTALGYIFGRAPSEPAHTPPPAQRQ